MNNNEQTPDIMIETNQDIVPGPDLDIDNELANPVKPKGKSRIKKPVKTITVQKTGIEIGVGEDKKFVDQDELYKLAALHCSLDELGKWFGVKPENLAYNFRDLIDKARSETKQKLRQAQFVAACDKYQPAMLIFLGKQYLGQRDKDDLSETKKTIDEAVNVAIAEILKDNDIVPRRKRVTNLEEAKKSNKN